MDTTELFDACFKLGLPLAVLSWFLFAWLHRAGRVDISGNQKDIEAELAQLKQARKKDRASLKEKLRNAFFKSEAGQDNKKLDQNAELLLDRWVWFGSGFYGLAAVWTLAVVEVMDLVNFISTFPGFAELFDNGVFALLISFVVNQFTNIYSAFAWFTYWTQHAVGLWILVAYAGYMIGMKIAKLQHQNG